MAFVGALSQSNGDTHIGISGSVIFSNQPGNSWGSTVLPGGDTKFFVSGAVAGLYPHGQHASDTDHHATAVFGGDTFISGVLKVGGDNFHPLAGNSVGGTISGSIHHTSGGLSYLKAGANIAISSASNGQITIASSGGGGVTPGGNNTQIQFNDGGSSFGGTDNLTWDGTNLLIGGADANAQLRFRNNDSYIISHQTSSLAFVVSGTDAGAEGPWALALEASSRSGGGLRFYSGSMHEEPLLQISGALKPDGNVYPVISGAHGRVYFTGWDVEEENNIVDIAYFKSAEEIGLHMNEDHQVYFGSNLTKVGQSGLNTGIVQLEGFNGVNINENGTTVIAIDTNRDVLFSETGGSTSDPDVEFDGYTRFDGTAEFKGDVAVGAGGKLTVQGPTYIFGDLLVSGTQTSVSSSNLVVKDPVITLAATISGTSDHDAFSFGVDGDRGIIFGIDQAWAGSPALIWDKSASISSGYPVGDFKLAYTTNSGTLGVGETFTTTKGAALSVAQLNISDNQQDFGNKIIIKSAENRSADATFTINAGDTGTEVTRALVFNEGFTIGGGMAGTLTFSAGSKTLTVADDCTVNQNLQTTDTVRFAKVTIDSANDHIDVASSDFTFTAASNAIVDAAKAIKLDADSQGAIMIMDGGTQFGGFSSNATDLIISASVSNKAMSLVVNDGGTPKAGITIDPAASTATDVDIILGVTGMGAGDFAMVPAVDNVMNLGSADKRFANVYTGDLHLRNDRGNWTMIEEPDYLSLTNNDTGKVYRILMEEVNPDDSSPDISSSSAGVKEKRSL